MNRLQGLATALSSFGNLFIVITAPQLRSRSLTPLAVYALQRSINQADREQAYSESDVTRESQRADYETSRAVSLLKRKGLVTVARCSEDKRVLLLIPTEQGRSVFREIMAASGKRLWNSIPKSARKRRVRALTNQLRDADKTLYGVWQPSFFDSDAFD